MTNRLSYLGPKGTYSEQAAIQYDNSAILVARSTIPLAADAINSDAADEAIVPIENSLGGAVVETLDLLIHQSGLLIKNEIALPIRHCLMASPGTERSEIRKIYSHPQSLSQCRQYLSRHFPECQLVASLSNSAAVEEMNGDRYSAAIAGSRAAALYNANILEENVEDNPTNATRFVVLSKNDHYPTGTDKTSICFEFHDDAPGILVTALGEFSSKGINLNKIESRPNRLVLGRYIFLVDIDGHRSDDIVRETLSAVEGHVSSMKILGSYPKQISSSI